jgi:SAM-dependent methyltransferase
MITVAMENRSSFGRRLPQTRPVNVDPRRVVRDGYDRIAESYLTARPSDGADMALLGDLSPRLPTDAAVLDAGCGAGFPLSADLARRGLRVVGLDFSARQLGLAQAKLGALELVQADLVHLPFGHASFDAVVSYYAIIHIPRSCHVGVFSEFHRVLRRGGMALLCLGWTDNPADHDPESWLGVPMFWSHYDADTNLHLLQQAGFGIEWSREVPDPMEHASHQFVLARRT